MKRREKTVEDEAGDGQPAWLTSFVAGGVEFNGDFGALIAARREWCRDHGCWRRPKTCVQTSGRECEARREANQDRGGET